MKGYWALFKCHFIAGLQYRTAAIAGIITQFVWGFLTILLYQLLGSQTMSVSELATYFWLRQSFLACITIWNVDTSIYTIIENGEIAYECLRPLNLYGVWFIKNVSLRLSRVVLRCGIVLLVALLLPEPFQLQLPMSGYHALAFLVSLLLTLCLIISINLMMYVLTIHTKKSLGVRVISTAVFDLLDGGNIPYPYFPEVIQSILQKSFFFGLQTTPFFIYLGRISIGNALLMQVFWVVLMVGIGYYFLTKSIKHIEIYGG